MQNVNGRVFIPCSLHVLADVIGVTHLEDIMSTASKLGPHTQTERGTCPGGALSLLQMALHYKEG
jgi:hypothetical protein